ncbi:MAG TPA: DUF1598 domain-containing protein, partial [Pirellulaceae bacterium]|nr:DUF1598 domain-containing protein [Pirellulaceae bacterium]
MSISVGRKSAVRWSVFCLAAIAGLLLAADVGFAQCGFGRFPSVGGVHIDANGALKSPDPADVNALAVAMAKAAKPVAGELNEKVALRKVSLRAIEAELAKAGQPNAAELPEEIRFLAGIQRIQYIFVDPDHHDIVLAGPGEGWKLDGRGNYVGVTTGLPVLRLEDLIVALRNVENARRGGITVSIDPTEEGRKKFEQFMKTQTRYTPAVLEGMATALGNQTITITGVPDTSRFARMLAASDYKMKRIAMELEASPIRELPSFLSMLQKGGAKLGNLMPRFWMACNYEPMGRSEDGLAWELRGKGVKVMTEDDYVAGGKATGTGKANPLAQKWSDLMTEHYDKLAVKEPVFGDLRNLMDLCVVAALIHKEGLLERAILQIPTMQDKDSK